MKRLFPLLFVLIMAAVALAGCGGTENTSDNAEPVSVDSLKTFGDVLALETEEVQTSVANGKAVQACKYNDTYYRFTADMPQETEQAYFEIDMAEDGFEEKQKELLAPLEISKTENLSEQILAQDALDALKGRSGQDLVADGWTYNGSYALDDSEFWMDYGPFTYTVTFDGTIDEENSDSFDAEEVTKDMKVKSVKLNMLSDAATNTD